MRNSRIAPLSTRRRGARPNPMIILAVFLLLIVGAIVFFSTQAREVPVGPIEVDVTNAAGR